jgi:ubiquinone/menaquinone biosynthesis C-methylase UbiE
MDALQYSKVTNGTLDPEPGFEYLYSAVRSKEGRALSDEEVARLPDIEASHPQYSEWQVRKRSLLKLVAYLSNKKKPLTILEIGCGNGWLASKLSAIANIEVIGLDINHDEIACAKRIFKKDNLDFVCDDFSPELFKGKQFDIILFAASIPYFSSISSILQQALTSLAPKGEIHIMDTHFYKDNEIAGAKARMENYYNALGYPEMSRYYYHYTLTDLAQFNYDILTDPRSILNRIGKKEPFYWIRIHHK